MGTTDIPSLKQGTGAQGNGTPPTQPWTLKVVEPVFEGCLVLGALPTTTVLQDTKDLECTDLSDIQQAVTHLGCLVQLRCDGFDFI